MEMKKEQHISLNEYLLSSMYVILYYIINLVIVVYRCIYLIVRSFMFMHMFFSVYLMNHCLKLYYTDTGLT